MEKKRNQIERNKMDNRMLEKNSKCKKKRSNFNPSKNKTHQILTRLSYEIMNNEDSTNAQHVSELEFSLKSNIFLPECRQTEEASRIEQNILENIYTNP